MKKNILLFCYLMLFSYTASFAVNVVSKHADDKSSQANSLELKSKDSKLKTKMANSKLFKKIKNVLDDTELILLVILAILLPPLAVFLKDGKTASTLFWITLILCLLGGAFWWGWYLGSFWFIAILLALLRVLDII